MATTGEKIRSIRIRRKKTLKDVANAVGASVTTISKYESGAIATIPISKLNAIADYLEINPAYLLGYSSEDQPLILSISEQLMMEDFRKLNESDKETICILIKRFIDVDQEKQEEHHSAVQLTL